MKKVARGKGHNTEPPKRVGRNTRGAGTGEQADEKTSDAVFVLPESEAEARLSCPCCWLSLAVNLNWGVEHLDKVIAAAETARRELAGMGEVA